MPVDFYSRHRELLERALAAIDAREFWTPYPESPSKSVYGENAAADGEAAFNAARDSRFELDQPDIVDWVGDEVSPYGFALGVRYPRSEPASLLAAAKQALPAWRDTGPQVRAGIAMEILARLNARSFEIANAVMHTSGQSFVMAFQAGGPHAQERGLEAVAYAYSELTRQPERVRWEKPARKGPALRLDKRFIAVPRGVGLVIGCNTFPTWNSYPGLFASLVTGNPVIVKPHPRAVLPLAISVRVAREVLAEAGFDPNLVTLAAESEGGRLAASLATHPDVRIVDFTGSTEFGDWLEVNARQAVVYTEKAGLNAIVVDSTDDYAGMLRNLAFTLSLYSGQMCTTSQNIFVSAAGIGTESERRSAQEFAGDLAEAVGKLLADPDRAVGTLGAIANPGVGARIDAAQQLDGVVLGSRPVRYPEYPDATIRTPVIVALDAGADGEVYRKEWFGPISFVITTESTEQSIKELHDTITEHGALTAGVYSTDESVLAAVERAALDAGVHLSENLTNGVFVNQSTAFSDFHGTGANPSATSSLTDPAYVTGRYFMVQSRRHAPADSG